MFHQLSDIPKAFQRQAKNNGYFDLAVGYHIKDSQDQKPSIAYRRIWIEPKYFSEHVKKKNNNVE